MEIEISTAKTELVPTGRLRVGVVAAPAVSTFFVALSADGQPQGVTVELGRQIGKALDMEAEFLVFSNSGLLTDAIEAGRVDVGLMPVDEERKGRIAFGASYFLIESTALAHGDSGFASVLDLDKSGVKVAGIENTTTIRSAQRVLRQATVIPVASVSEAIALLESRRVDALVLSRDVLETYNRQIAGSRVLADHLHATGIAIAVQKGRAAGLAWANRFLEEAKASGAIRRAFDEAGFPTAPIAPLGM